VDDLATPVLLRTREQETVPRVFSAIMETEIVLFFLVAKTLIANSNKLS